MMSLSNTDVIIMAGGLGTRLRGAIWGPKCLAMIASKPALFYHLEDLRQRGAQRVILSLGYEATTVLIRLSNRDVPQIPFVAVVESAPLGYAEAFKAAYRVASTREVLVLNADTFCPGGIDAVLHECRGARCREPVVAITARRGDSYAGVGVGWNYPGAVLGPFEQAPNNQRVDVPVDTFLDYGTPETLDGAEDYLRQHGMIA